LAIRTAMARLGAGLPEDLLAADTGYRGPRVKCEAGHRAEFVSYRTKTIDTVLGPAGVRRAYYHCGQCGHGIVPRDAELGVGRASMSPGLAKMTARAAAAAPFAKAGRLLAELAGAQLTAKRIVRSAEAGGAAAAAAITAQADAIGSRQVIPLPPPAPLPDMLYLAVDGTGVPMVAAETEGRPGKGDDGRAHTREVKLACLFTQTALDDEGHPVRDPGSSTYLATFERAARFAQLAGAEARRHGAEHIRQLVVLGDGAVWIWNLADQLFPAATQIVDLCHAREHACDLANLATRLLRQSHPDWLTERLAELDAGDIPALTAAGRGLKIHRLPGPRPRQATRLLRDQRPPHALRLLPRAGHVRQLRLRRSRLQSRHRPASQALRHALGHPRRHQHRHPALPRSQRPLGRHLAAAPQPDSHHHPSHLQARTHSDHRRLTPATYKIGARPAGGGAGL
jgi:hypothetical protein